MRVRCFPIPRLLRGRRRQGFSLVELSVVVAIISVVATLGLEAAANFMNRSAINATRANLAVIDDALVRFVKIYGRLPCPADITAGLTNNSATFGVEDCTLPVFANTDTENIGGGVVGGMVPFRALNLPMTTVADGFGNRINYVVTKNLTTAGGNTTVADRFGSVGFADDDDNGIGGIEIRTGRLEAACDGTGACQKLADPANGTGAAYIIFSNGTDQFRGVPLRSSGAVFSGGCSLGSGQVDRINCQWGLENTYPDNAFHDNRYNAGIVANNYFDDVVMWRTKAQL